MKILILVLISTVVVVVLLFMPAISQDTQYHHFADQLELAGIPNFLNVVSNIPFMITGIIGFHFISVNKQAIPVNSLRAIYLLFFSSVFVLGCGSAFYHLAPDNLTLIWDRLPMSVAFMSFFIIILAEYINPRLAVRLAIPLLMLGVTSVIYWYWSESMGKGDLRMYALVQFLPLILIPLILIMYSSSSMNTVVMWLLLGCYLLAKGFELMDYPVYQLTTVISGHSIKHLVSAAGPYLLYLVLKERHRLRIAQTV